ncbi:hypothetical protein BMT55_04050 [Listeria newyorkensis]|uniref:Uncharacterized protein n=1 Tax=Listeria newyorkensis TaxID=1497681 RepID=A0ABX4XQ55_9LIST|nr:hypothetical protein [Listeria newyorkensis]KGL41934.1 hypothetical protein EP58_10360 [Listeria newyorkensis]PNP93948.1 hypothetical protein BMT55_04050 [Listeria newyorkensis]WAO22574.1 hypothetical protein OTR81_04685 [Listeria newyorkensis]SQC51292.1 Cell wall-associated polypeptide CWBP200 [Listeria newyorkensis]
MRKRMIKALVISLSLSLVIATVPPKEVVRAEETVVPSKGDSAVEQDLPEGQFARLLKATAASTVKMTVPIAKSYALDGSSNKGYLDIRWQAMTGAIGYKVGLFNGVTYDFVDVGNVLNWSTKGQGVWPTASEISDGKYALHTDGKGTDLVLDPSIVYANAYKATKKTDYSSRLTHFVRIIAVYPDGDSAPSDIIAPRMPFADIDNVSIVMPKVDENSGVISMSWDAVNQAVGYKVWLFDGKSYHAYDVKNELEWSSLEKGIWPTKDEIARGKKGLHNDGVGTEIAADPTPVYQLNNPSAVIGTDYRTHVTAYDANGETIAFHQNENSSVTESDASEQVAANLIEDMDPYVSVKDGYFDVAPIPATLKAEYGAETVQAMEDGIEKINAEVAEDKAVIGADGVVRSTTDTNLLQANQTKFVWRWWGTSSYYSKARAVEAAYAFAVIAGTNGGASSIKSLLPKFIRFIPLTAFFGLSAAYFGLMSASIAHTNAKTNRGVILNVTWAAVYWTTPQGK